MHFLSVFGKMVEIAKRFFILAPSVKLWVEVVFNLEFNVCNFGVYLEGLDGSGIRKSN